MYVGRGGCDIVRIHIIHPRAVGNELQAHLVYIEIAVGGGVAVGHKCQMTAVGGGIVEVYLVQGGTSGVDIHRVECHKGAGIVGVGHSAEIEIVIVGGTACRCVEAQAQLAEHGLVGIDFGQYHAFVCGHARGCCGGRGQINIDVFSVAAIGIGCAGGDVGVVVEVCA